MFNVLSKLEVSIIFDNYDAFGSICCKIFGKRMGKATTASVISSGNFTTRLQKF